MIYSHKERKLPCGFAIVCLDSKQKKEGLSMPLSMQMPTFASTIEDN